MKDKTLLCPNCKELTLEYGAKGICYKCYMRDFNKLNYQKNKEKIREQTREYYYSNHKERKRQKNESQKRNLKYKIYQKKYYEENKKELLKNMNDYYEENKEERLKKQYKYKKQKLKTNVEFKLKDRLSSRIRSAIMNHQGTKNSSAIELLGADIVTVRKHIESQFKDGMNWENHGIRTWHIDHRVPCDSFDLTNEEQQKRCFHYTNLQPLWYKENLQKSNTL